MNKELEDAANMDLPEGEGDDDFWSPFSPPKSVFRHWQPLLSNAAYHFISKLWC
jgi:hypothetical protein